MRWDWYVELSGEATQSVARGYIPRLQAAVEETDFDWWDLNIIQHAQAIDPAPLTRDLVLERIPYMAAEQVDRLLRTATERGGVAAGPEGHSITAEGRAFHDRIQGIVNEGLAEMAEDAPEDLVVLADLLGRQVRACVSDPGIEKPAIELSRRYDPGDDAPPMARIRRYLQDLNAFRDDAHVAAWRAEDVAGHEWEVFSHVWGEKVWGDPVDTPAEAAEKLGFRGYDEAGYAAALEGLEARGWLTQEDGRYRVSEEGARVRAAAEARTDEHFFGPWQLSEAEARTLKTGLASLRDAFAPEEG